MQCNPARPSKNENGNTHINSIDRLFSLSKRALFKVPSNNNMKLLYFPLLLTAVVAEPIMVYTSRSVAQQIGMGSCFPHAGSNIRAQRFTQPLTPGEYKFLANVTQTISILEAGCKTVSSSVQSFVWFGDELVAGKSTLAQGCKPISTTDSIEGMFTVREEGPVHLVLHTQVREYLSHFAVIG